MMSAHVVRSRHNLAASTVYLMRAGGMQAFQTLLLPALRGNEIQAANHTPVAELLPSKYCGVVPVTCRVNEMKGDPAMDMATYASLDESETRFDGAVARDHLARRLAMSISRMEDAPPQTRAAFEQWRVERSRFIRTHPRGSYLLEAPRWWD